MEGKQALNKGGESGDKVGVGNAYAAHDALRGCDGWVANSWWPRRAGKGKVLSLYGSWRKHTAL